MKTSSFHENDLFSFQDIARRTRVTSAKWPLALADMLPLKGLAGWVSWHQGA